MAGMTDLQCGRIPNQWILIGYITGAYVNVSLWGAKGILIFLFNVLWPILLLYLLFFIRAIGAGDVKLFSALASIAGAEVTWRVMTAAFAAGAFISLIRLIRRRQLFWRIARFASYTKSCLSSRRLSSYSTEEMPESYLHFSLCILIGYGSVQLLEVIS